MLSDSDVLAPETIRHRRTDLSHVKQNHLGFERVQVSASPLTDTAANLKLPPAKR